MAARRGRRSNVSKLARQADEHRRGIERALAYADVEARKDRLHAEQSARAGLRGVGIVTRGMAVPERASVTRMPMGQWQAMASDVPLSLSDARASEYARDRRRERAATVASNHLLAADRAAGEVQAIADAMRRN